MVVRWSAVESNPLEQYLAPIDTMLGENAHGARASEMPRVSGDDDFTIDDLPPELREWIESVANTSDAAGMPPELHQLLQQINQSGIGPDALGRRAGGAAPNDPLANLGREELVQLLVDYFANAMHQQNQQRATPPRNAGNMGGPAWSGGRPASWPSGNGSSGGGAGSGGGTSSGGGGGSSGSGGAGGPLQSRTNGAGLPSPATGHSRIPGGLQRNAANGARVVREQLGFDGVIGGIGQRAGRSDHPSGNALDVMTQNNVQKGREVAEHFRQNADRLGVKYVIYQQQIASPSSNPPWSWRPMEDRGGPTANHMDHVHISFH